MIKKDIGINKKSENQIVKHDLLNNEGISFIRRNNIAGNCDIITTANETRVTLVRLSSDVSSFTSTKGINIDRVVIGVVAISPINGAVNIKYHLYLYKAILVFKISPFKNFLLKKYKQNEFAKVVITNNAHILFELSSNNEKNAVKKIAVVEIIDVTNIALLEYSIVSG
ncbi:hypothetical protein [Erwinia mallotivora]|uniref:hypothetical protein n=1 Tax=Erwinia mallotivora TaxID=69222 RepID=UPI0021C1373E|nr:hypothetical protein [Erwinia mallotivora]